MTDSENRWPNPKKDDMSLKKDLDGSVNADDRSGESEDVFRLLSDQSLIGIVIIQDNVFKYANKGAADILGYSKEEMLSWGPNEFSKIIHPDDIPFVMTQARKSRPGIKMLCLITPIEALQNRDEYAGLNCIPGPLNILAEVLIL